MLNLSFNSMIVRLKDCTTRTTLFASIRRFNSMIVRLKAIKANFKSAQLNGFNSMIVRLKDHAAGGAHQGPHTFQFYDSPIKSISHLP